MRYGILICVAALAIGHEVGATRVNASNFGFNASDATDALQSAINSGADTVYVPAMGSDWVVRMAGNQAGITLRSNQRIEFAPGVVIMAKQGSFTGIDDNLFRAVRVNNLVLHGYGATLRMRKSDYQQAPYSHSEYRHVLRIDKCSNVRVLGLKLQSSGGDGVYVCSDVDAAGYSDNILIKDCILDDNHRQGTSVCSARNLTYENCIISRTSGTEPQCGQDVEPFVAQASCVNIVMNNCVFYDNASNGIRLDLGSLRPTSPEMSFTFKRCYSISGHREGIALLSMGDNSARGTVLFEDCVMSGSSVYGAILRDKSDLAARVSFLRCQWQNPGNYPVYFWNTGAAQNIGGIQFTDCVIHDTQNRPVLYKSGGGGLADISGTITVWNPNGATQSLGTSISNVDVELIEKRTRAPILTIATPSKAEVFTGGQDISVTVRANDPDAGSSDGSGMRVVRMDVIRGNDIVTTQRDSVAPYTFTIATQGREQGVYTIAVSASSSDGSTTISAVPVVYLDPSSQSTNVRPGSLRPSPAVSRRALAIGIDGRVLAGRPSLRPVGVYILLNSPSGALRLTAR